MKAARAAARRAACAGLRQGLIQIDAGRVQRRCDSEKHGRNPGGRKSERQHAPVEPDFIQPRNIGRREAHQQRRNPDGDQQAERARGQRQQAAFGEHLANNARAAGAHGGADGDFACAPGGFGQQQVRDIGAGDQQHQRDGAEQKVEREAHVRNHFVAHQDDGGALAFVARGILLRQARGDGGHLRLRCARRDAWFQPCNHPVIVAAARNGFRNHRIRRIPDVGLFRKMKTGRRHSGDRQAAIENANGFADGGVLAREMLLPIGVADNHRAGFSFFFSEKMSRGGLQLKNVKEFRSYCGAVRVLGLCGRRGRALVVFIVGHRIEGGRLIVPVVEIGRRDRSVVPGFLPQRCEGDDAVRLVIRERTQQHGIHHAEHCRIRADADAERQDRDGGYGRRFGQHANPVPDVLPQIFHRRPRRARLPIDKEYAAERGNVPSHVKLG